MSKICKKNQKKLRVEEAFGKHRKYFLGDQTMEVIEYEIECYFGQREEIKTDD